MKHCLYLFLFLVTFSPGALAQEKSTEWVLEPVLHYGSIVPHHEFMQEFLDGPLVAGELKWGIQTTGQNAWEQLYGFPRYGFGVYYGNIGNRQVLGNPLALYSFYDIPLLRAGHFRLNTQFALGLAGGFHPYDPEENPLNLAIGSRMNVFFYYNLNVGLRLSDQVYLVQGANFTHFSNGALSLPNTGFYLLDYYISLQYRLHPGPLGFERKTLPAPGKRHEGYVLLAAGSKKTSIGGRSWFTSTLSLGYSYRLSRINRLVIGFDSFYDSSLEQAFPGEDPAFAEILRAGVFAGHELLIGPFRVVVNQGIYLYRKVNTFQDYFSRLGLRYVFHSGLMPSVSIKSHWGKADYIEWGLGYVF